MSYGKAKGKSKQKHTDDIRAKKKGKRDSSKNQELANSTQRNATQGQDTREKYVLHSIESSNINQTYQQVKYDLK